MAVELPVAETFFSIQGEGPTQGVPALFLRLGGCNLNCGKNTGATWKCDTLHLWKNAKKMSSTDLIKLWREQGWIDRLEGNAHLVITGGEPLLHEEKIYNFLVKELPVFPHTEIETNGTIEIFSQLHEAINQYNISPKLSNSGELKEKRLNPSFIEWAINNCEDNANFKFVITSESDWDEVKRDFIVPYNIPNHMIWLMAGASSTEELISRNKMVAELAIQECVNFSNRIQIQIWDKRTGK